VHLAFLGVPSATRSYPVIDHLAIRNEEVGLQTAMFDELST
jgi:hypothetical protein